MNRSGTSGEAFHRGVLVRRGLALLAGAVFVYAGILKVRDPLQFALDVNNYHLVSWPIGVRLAFYLPWLEILAGLALIFYRAFSGALAITGALMLGFIGATIWAEAQGINVDCGCFGAAGSNLSFSWHLVLNLSILLVLLFLWFTRAKPDEITPARAASA
ncbi:MAG: MauE/DoxX family redox-associated membrane protein [Spartobacteria bacterium]